MSESIKVAIVDDEVDSRQHLLNELHNYAEYSRERGDAVSFDISEFNSGDALLAEYRSDYDLLLLDVEMNGTDGMETARQIRQRDSRVMIVFVTNMAQYAVHRRSACLFGL